MTKNAFEMDIHNMQRRYENAARNLLEHQGIGQENKQKILQFLEYCQAQDLSLARRLFYLQWLELHPCRERPDAPLWVCLEGEHAGEALGYDRARKLIQQLADKAGIKKRVNPYQFRHSTITALATELTEAEMCEIFGWTQGSRMPRVYVHLSGRDVDQKILKIHGVIKENQVEKRTLERRKCQRCGTENPPEGHFCTVCTAPLDARAVSGIIHLGGTFLKTARAEEMKTKDGIS